MMNQRANQLARLMMSRRVKLARKRKKMYIMYKVYICHYFTIPYHKLPYHKLPYSKNNRNKLVKNISSLLGFGYQTLLITKQ